MDSSANTQPPRMDVVGDDSNCFCPLIMCLLHLFVCFAVQIKLPYLDYSLADKEADIAVTSDPITSSPLITKVQSRATR